MNNRKFGALTSVETQNLPFDQQKFSQMWSGVIGLISTILAALAALKGIDATVADVDIKVIVDALTVAGTAIVAVWQAVQIGIGAVKKVSYWFANR